MADVNKVTLPIAALRTLDNVEFDKVWRTRISWAIILYGLVVYLTHLYLHTVSTTELLIVILLMVFNVVSVAGTSFVQFRELDAGTTSQFAGWLFNSQFKQGDTGAKSHSKVSPECGWWFSTHIIHVLLLYYQHLSFFVHPRNPYYKFWFVVVGTPFLAPAVAITGYSLYKLLECLYTCGCTFVHMPLLVVDVIIGYFLLCINYFCWCNGFLWTWSSMSLYCALDFFTIYYHVAVYAHNVAVQQVNFAMYVVTYVFVQGGHGLFVALVVKIMYDEIDDFVSWMFLDTFVKVLAVSVALFGTTFCWFLLCVMWRASVFVWKQLTRIDLEGTLDNALNV